MNKTFLASLIGPFDFSNPPVRKGWYVVDATTGETAYFDGTRWFNDDDGLSDPLDLMALVGAFKGWWGQRAQEPEEDDGLGV